MANPIGWFEIYVNDMERAKTFYQTVFNLSLESLGDPTDSGAEMWVFPSDFEKYGSTGALIKTKEFPAGGNSTVIYFLCQD